MHVTDNYLVNKNFFLEIFGTIELRLGLFHYIQRITDTMNIDHPDFNLAVPWLSKCLYYQDKEDVKGVIDYLEKKEAAKLAKSNKKNKKTDDGDDNDNDDDDDDDDDNNNDNNNDDDSEEITATAAAAASGDADNNNSNNDKKKEEEKDIRVSIWKKLLERFKKIFEFGCIKIIP